MTRPDLCSSSTATADTGRGSSLFGPDKGKASASSDNTSPHASAARPCAWGGGGALHSRQEQPACTSAAAPAEAHAVQAAAAGTGARRPASSPPLSPSLCPHRLALSSLQLEALTLSTAPAASAPLAAPLCDQRLNPPSAAGLGALKRNRYPSSDDLRALSNKAAHLQSEDRPHRQPAIPNDDDQRHPPSLAEVQHHSNSASASGSASRSAPPLTTVGASSLTTSAMPPAEPVMGALGGGHAAALPTHAAVLQQQHHRQAAFDPHHQLALPPLLARRSTGDGSMPPPPERRPLHACVDDDDDDAGLGRVPRVADENSFLQAQPPPTGRAAAPGSRRELLARRMQANPNVRLLSKLQVDEFVPRAPGAVATPSMVAKSPIQVLPSSFSAPPSGQNSPLQP